MEMVQLFMSGVHPSILDIQDSYLEELLREYRKLIIDYVKDQTNCDDVIEQLIQGKLENINEEIIKDFNKKLADYLSDFASPVTSVVTSLTIEDLAAMAESLVNLTLFRQKVSLGIESVGGPIDVAVISKGDGFIWIRRKHYFEPELNPRFIGKYYKE